LPVEVCEGDLRDAAAVHRAVEGCAEVYHVAAEYTFWSPDPATVFASNVVGTKNVMEAALAHRVPRVVYTSTVGTIGLGGEAPRETPRDEASPPAEGQFTGAYKRSKLEAEEAVMSFAARGLPVVVVNPSAPVGPWDRKPTPTGKILVDFMRGKVPAFLDTGLNVVHARDVAEGHVLAAEKGRVGERYILGGVNLSLAQILERLAAITGRRSPTLRVPLQAAYVAGWASTFIANHITHRPPAIPLEAVKMARFHMYFSPAKAIRELGLQQTPPEVALRDALAWFAERSYFEGWHPDNPVEPSASSIP
jgi:dihydroflavonol-4-reductase